jgi:nucleotide-binding universal stress UspA family protein
MRQPRPEAVAAERLLIEAVLFNSGRPVLVVPYIHEGKANLERITVCWDGSKAAARAVADSLPLLAQAKHVDLLTITEKWTPGTVFEASDMAIHLTRHNVRLNVVEQPRGEIDIGSTILNFAADNGVDLLVMGGYGHPRLGEAIFGGATLTMLQSMTVPTLMSH